MNIVTVASTTWLGWIRPWYVGAVQPGTGLIEGHIYPDCARLLRIESEPREGTGWLDPQQEPICGLCNERHANGEEPKP